MIDDIFFEIEGTNQPSFFINCQEEPREYGYNPLEIPTVFFLSDETWFHSHTKLLNLEEYY